MYWREDRLDIYLNTENSRKYYYSYPYYFDSYLYLNKTIILYRYSKKRIHSYREYNPIYKNTLKVEPEPA